MRRLCSNECTLAYDKYALRIRALCSIDDGASGSKGDAAQDERKLHAVQSTADTADVRGPNSPSHCPKRQRTQQSIEHIKNTYIYNGVYVGLLQKTTPGQHYAVQQSRPLYGAHRVLRWGWLTMSEAVISH